MITSNATNIFISLAVSVPKRLKKIAQIPNPQRSVTVVINKPLNNFCTDFSCWKTSLFLITNSFYQNKIYIQQGGSYSPYNRTTKTSVLKYLVTYSIVFLSVLAPSSSLLDGIPDGDKTIVISPFSYFSTNNDMLFFQILQYPYQILHS